MTSAASTLVITITLLATMLGCGTDNSGSSKSRNRKSESERAEPAGQKRNKNQSKPPKDEPKAETTAGRKSPATSSSPSTAASIPTVDGVDFESLDLDTAIALAQPNLHLIAKRQRKINSGRGRSITSKHDWRIKIPYLGHQRGIAYTYLNDKLVDSVNLYLVPDLSQDAIKTYQHHDTGNFGGSTFELKLTVVHNRAEGKCEIRFYRYDSWDNENTIGGANGYLWNVDCPRAEGSVKGEIDYSRPNWKLKGSGVYSGYTGTYYPAVEAWVVEYEALHPRLKLIAFNKLHADITLLLKRNESTNELRVYEYGPDGDGRKARFTKNITTQICTFDYSDAYFKQGVSLNGACTH